jgi:hypothetical protein
MLAYEITRFNRDYNNREDEDPTYTKKITYSPVEVMSFLETGIVPESTVVVLVWDEKKFVASFTYGA